VHESSLFCNLEPAALQELNSLRQSSLYPKGAVLFVEGQPARGIFVLCTGKAKLSTASPQGRAVILRIAEAGEVLGLSAVLAGQAYEANAETLEPAQVNFLPGPDFLRFLQHHGQVSVRVAQHLSMELRRAYQQVSRIALGASARAKLAALLLDWAGRDGQPAASGLRFQLRLKHEEIGELLGSTRETVSRLFGEFRRQGLVQTKGSLITLRNPDRLRSLLS
jgi:CRP/FNR family transcriptional regulator